MKHTVQQLVAMDAADAIGTIRGEILEGLRPLLGSNTKVEKAKGLGIRTAGLALAPANESVPFGGRDLCPGASAGCIAACLRHAGCNVLPYNSLLRIAKTLGYLFDRTIFEELLFSELERHIRNSLKAGQVPAFRSQVLHDHPSFGAKVARKFPTLRVYDYTALVEYLVRQGDAGVDVPNYHLTVSRKENNELQCIEALSRGVNVAVVFDGPLPATWHGFPVLDGDEHDARFLDPAGHVVGLKLKGTKAAKQAARDSGFAVATA